MSFWFSLKYCFRTSFYNSILYKNIEEKKQINYELKITKQQI